MPRGSSPSMLLPLLGLLVATAAGAQAPLPPPPPDGGGAAPTSRPGDGGALPATDGGAPPATPKQPSATATPEGRLRWLGARLDEILGQPGLAAAKASVLVAEVEGGRVLYRRNETQVLNPASNVKLFTTAAALAQLGPEFRFRTQLLADGLKGGEVDGNLYLRGQGDPSFGIEDLWRMVADLGALGVRRVSGDLAIDDSYFDEARLPPGFEQKDEDFPFRAPTGAVSMEQNACTVRVLPAGREGAPPRVVIDPASPYFVVDNRAVTVAKGRTELTVRSREIDGHTQIAVEGRIRVGASPVVEHRRIAHPDLFAAYALKELLARRNIKLTGKIVHAVAPEKARLLVTHQSPPLGVIVREINKRSINFMAEEVLKAIGAEAGGRPGSFAKGIEVVSRYLDGLGIPAAQFKMTNGSGLYDANRFSAQHLVTLLRAVFRDFRYAADFVGSLALAGADGTIGRRLGGSPAERWVRAKTGTLDGVSALSGYAGAPNRMPLAFAVLLNGLPAESGAVEARRAQDAIAEALVLYLDVKAH